MADATNGAPKGEMDGSTPADPSPVQAVHPSVRAFIDHFRKADVLGGQRTYAQTRVAFEQPAIAFEEPTGAPDNEVFRASWIEDDGTPQVMRLTEGDIIRGRWEGASFLSDNADGEPVQLTGFALIAMPQPGSIETQGEGSPAVGLDEDADDGDDSEALPATVEPQDIAIFTRAADVPALATNRWLQWSDSPAASPTTSPVSSAATSVSDLVGRLRNRYPDRVTAGEGVTVVPEPSDPRYFASPDSWHSTSIGVLDGRVGVYTKCESALRLAQPGEMTLQPGESDANGTTPLAAASFAAAMAAWQIEAAQVAPHFPHSRVFITHGDPLASFDGRACLCAFTPLEIDETSLIAASPYRRDDSALLMLGDALNRVAEGSGGYAALERAARRLGEVRAVGQTPAYVLVQEGGSSFELYLHAWDSAGEAEEDRVSCSRDGAYQTTEVAEVPAHLAAHPAFYDVAEALMRKAGGAWYEKEDAIVPITLACHPDFSSVCHAINASLDGLECVDVPEESHDENETAG